MDIEIFNSLTERLSIRQVKSIAQWIEESDNHFSFLWDKTYSPISKVAINALWVLTHALPETRKHLSHLQAEIISSLLNETSQTKKRLFLQILKKQEFNPYMPYTSHLLDYCLSKINAQSEPYATRCFSLYVAYNISGHFPELLDELNQYLDLLSTQSLSPGLKSALRQTRSKISKMGKSRSEKEPR